MRKAWVQDPPGSSSESKVDGDTNGVIEDEGEFDDVGDVFEGSYNFPFRGITCRFLVLYERRSRISDRAADSENPR